MIDEHLVWPYWSVDLPGLSEANAQRLLAWAESEGASLGGTAVDPASSFTVHLDEATVESLSGAVEFMLRSQALPREHEAVVRFISELLAEWLSTRPSASDSG